jgi:hypothetical protein
VVALPRTFTFVAFGLLLAALVPQAVAQPSTLASGGGIGLGGARLCGHPPVPVAFQLTLASDGGNAWNIELAAVAADWCGYAAALSCQGLGSLEAGIELTECLADPARGHLGPFFQVLAFCAGPCPNVYRGDVSVSSLLGSFDGSAQMVVHQPA